MPRTARGFASSGSSLNFIGLTIRRRRAQHDLGPRTSALRHRLRLFLSAVSKVTPQETQFGAEQAVPGNAPAAWRADSPSERWQGRWSPWPSGLAGPCRRRSTPGRVRPPRRRRPVRVGSDLHDPSGPGTIHQSWSLRRAVRRCQRRRCTATQLFDDAVWLAGPPASPGPPPVRDRGVGRGDRRRPARWAVDAEGATGTPGSSLLALADVPDTGGPLGHQAAER